MSYKLLRERKILVVENMVVVLLWGLAFMAPVLFTNDYNRNWTTIYVTWIESCVIGVVFLINKFFLKNKLFFKKKYFKYSLSLALLFICLAVFLFYYDGVNIVTSYFNIELGETTLFNSPPPLEGSIPHPLRGDVIPPPQIRQVTSPPPTNMILHPSLVVFIISVIVLALDMGLSIAVKWIISEQREAEIKKERVSAQLFNLQSQVSPHFFMNTLNNIHALVDIDAVRAKQTIIQLSGLMDYLLYKSSNRELISLQKEIGFIDNYISLMRLRYPKRVVIDFTYNTQIPNIEIPPLLFINFIENAFKYGVDYTKESFIDIHFDFDSENITMVVLNTNHSESVKSERHGLGISNSIKRLKLLYGDKYSLKIKDEQGIYSTTLTINNYYDKLHNTRR